jgi:hypothetical protein
MDNIKALSPDVVKNLIPTVSPWQGIDPPKKSILKPIVQNLLQDIQQIQMNWINLKMSMIEGTKSEEDYSMYLQYPNAEIKALVNTIVSPGDTNDEKAYKIMSWVQDNIEYKSDFENYKTDEYWALPTMTLARKSGDCEDGAFLIHSMMLNAGIPYEQIRTYGGEVYAGPGAGTGGHAWTAYQRETDNEWVDLDWCYYASDKPIDDRTPMKDILYYFDDWFYMNAKETIETPFVNKVKDPSMAYGALPVKNFVKGQMINTTA